MGEIWEKFIGIIDLERTLSEFFPTQTVANFIRSWTNKNSDDGQNL